MQTGGNPRFVVDYLLRQENLLSGEVVAKSKWLDEILAKAKQVYGSTEYDKKYQLLSLFLGHEHENTEVLKGKLGVTNHAIKRARKHMKSGGTFKPLKRKKVAPEVRKPIQTVRNLVQHLTSPEHVERSSYRSAEVLQDNPLTTYFGEEQLGVLKRCVLYPKLFSKFLLM